jgi:hypothetical protein
MRSPAFAHGELRIDGFVVDGDQPIADLHAGQRRGRVFDCVGDAHVALVDGNFQTDTGILAARADAEVFELARTEEGRVRIEFGHHAADRRFDEWLVAELFDAVDRHTLDDFGEQAGVTPRKDLAEGEIRRLVVRLPSGALRRRLRSPCPVPPCAAPKVPRDSAGASIPRHPTRCRRPRQRAF